MEDDITRFEEKLGQDNNSLIEVIQNKIVNRAAS